MQVACLEGDMASFIKPLSSALEDVDIGEKVMFRGTVFVELCFTNIAVYWVVKFLQLTGWRDKKREKFETVSQHGPDLCGSTCYSVNVHVASLYKLDHLNSLNTSAHECMICEQKLKTEAYLRNKTHKNTHQQCSVYCKVVFDVT